MWLPLGQKAWQNNFLIVDKKNNKFDADFKKPIKISKQPHLVFKYFLQSLLLETFCHKGKFTLWKISVICIFWYTIWPILWKKISHVFVSEGMKIHVPAGSRSAMTYVLVKVNQATRLQIQCAHILCLCHIYGAFQVRFTISVKSYKNFFFASFFLKSPKTLIEE